MDSDSFDEFEILDTVECSAVNDSEFSLARSSCLNWLANLSTGSVANSSATKICDERFVDIKQPSGRSAAEDEDNDYQEIQEEDMTVEEIYAEYKPTENSTEDPHVDQVIETVSMASVSPPDVKIQLRLPCGIVDNCKLSALQFETVAYACQQHKFYLTGGFRSGFCIGDGAGVGKGRTIAGIIYENYLHGRTKSIWISISPDLILDAERDLSDIGASMIPVYPVSRMGKENIENGVVFMTYSTLIAEPRNKQPTRLNQLTQWCGEKFNGIIVFDECHRAKNLCQAKGSRSSKRATKTGLFVHRLQKDLPRARVVYASATGASEPRNMAYMTRLGIWGKDTPFADFDNFSKAVEERGIGAMEVVSMDMKLRGAYVARQLSFKGVTYCILDVPFSKNSIEIYDESVDLWTELLENFTAVAESMNKGGRSTIWGQFWGAHQRFFKCLCCSAKIRKAAELAREAVAAGECAVIGLYSTGEAATLDYLESSDRELNNFVSTAKFILRALVENYFPNVPYQVKHVADPTSTSRSTASCNKRPFSIEALCAFGPERLDDSVNLSGEHALTFNDEPPSKRRSTSSAFNYSSSESDDGRVKLSCIQLFSMSPKVANVHPYLVEDAEFGLFPEGGEAAKYLNQPKDCNTKSTKAILLEKIEKLGERLPPNPIDQLIHELGGPEKVAEMTGRKYRLVKGDNGKVHFEARSKVSNLESVNHAEKERFLKGQKYIAIISEAGSTGISLHSDKRVRNQKRRVHITLELPWGADRAVQQFGRTHRRNQSNSPRYVMLVTDVAGEYRFASMVAKRLESLGALTNGDRRATESHDMVRFNVDNKYGWDAFKTVIQGTLEKTVLVPADYEGDYFVDMTNALTRVGILKEERGIHVLQHNSIRTTSTFLNRILGMSVNLQKHLFKYFTDTLDMKIKQAKRAGTYDEGILDLSLSTNMVLRKEKVFEVTHATGIGKVELHEVQVERSMKWDHALEKFREIHGEPEGFYLSKQAREDRRWAILVISETRISGAAENEISVYTVYRPNTGMQVKRELLEEVEKSYEKVIPPDAKRHWISQWEASKTVCSHSYWTGKKCNKSLHCEIGVCHRTYHVLSGSVLLAWGKVAKVLKEHGMQIQIVRMRLPAEERIVGVLVPNICTPALRELLAKPPEPTMP